MGYLLHRHEYPEPEGNHYPDHRRLSRQDNIQLLQKRSLPTNPYDLVPEKERCGTVDVNSLDIDTSAYPALSDGEGYQSVSRYSHPVVPCP